MGKWVRRKWRKPYESEPEGREWANGDPNRFDDEDDDDGSDNLDSQMPKC